MESHKNSTKMKIDIKYCPIKWYTLKSINQWMWHFRPYKYIQGFTMRILGVWINIREGNAFNKLVETHLSK